MACLMQQHNWRQLGAFIGGNASVPFVTVVSILPVEIGICWVMAKIGDASTWYTICYGHTNSHITFYYYLSDKLCKCFVFYYCLMSLQLFSPISFRFFLLALVTIKKEYWWDNPIHWDPNKIKQKENKDKLFVYHMEYTVYITEAIK